MNDNLTKVIEKIYDEAEHSPLGRDEYINTLLGCMLKENIELRKACCDLKGTLGKTVLVNENEELKQRVLDLAINLHQFRDDDLKKFYEIQSLQKEVQDYKEENVKLLRQCLKLYRALMKQRDEAEKVMETCAHNVWFSRLKERTY